MIYHHKSHFVYLCLKLNIKVDQQLFSKNIGLEFYKYVGIECRSTCIHVQLV